MPFVFFKYFILLVIVLKVDQKFKLKILSHSSICWKFFDLNLPEPYEQPEDLVMVEMVNGWKNEKFNGLGLL